MNKVGKIELASSLSKENGRYEDAIKSLWAAIFDETDDFLNLFFEKVFRPENCMIAVNESGNLCAALQMIPYSFVVDGKTISASYIYAVMTAPDERRKGYMDLLLNATFEELRRLNIPLVFLIPQEEYLIDVYQKYGFEQAFRIQKETVSLPDAEVEYFTPSIEKSYKFYQEFYKNTDGVKLTFEQFEFVCIDLRQDNGEIIAIKEDKKISGLCLAKKEDEQLITLDFLATNEKAHDHLLAALSHKFQTQAVHISYFTKNGGNEFAGMAKILNETEISFRILENSYISLMMDK
jgi:predicted acetyltransferase